MVLRAFEARIFLQLFSDGSHCENYSEENYDCSVLFPYNTSVEAAHLTKIEDITGFSIADIQLCRDVRNFAIATLRRRRRRLAPETFV